MSKIQPAFCSPEYIHRWISKHAPKVPLPFNLYAANFMKNEWRHQMRKHTPQQTDQDFLLVKKSFYFLRDIVGMSLEDIATYCGRNPGTINQYRCNTRTTPPEVREKLAELAKLRGYDPTQEMRADS